MKDQGHPDLLALAEQAWRGELDLQFEHHPVHRYYPGSCRIAEDLLGFKGIAGFYVIDSGDGLVMLDAGHLLDVKRCFENVSRWRPDTPVTAAIYSHHHALAGTARYMRSIEEQSVAAMNRGSSLDQVVQSVKPPADLADEPYLQPIYDDPSFLVRMVWRRYGGWWNGEFDNLMPAARATQALAWVELAGGVGRVVEQARASSAAGRHAVACHLIEAARHAAPESAEVHEARAAIYRANAESQPSSMARNILNHAALASDRGRRDLASDE